LYNETVLDHFHNPRNVGELDEPDGVGEVGNPVCGDVMRIEIKVEDDRIKDIKFRTFGCGAAIATSSMVTEMVKGKTLEEALSVSNRMVAQALGGLPKQKMHCSNLAADALHKAIEDYRRRLGRLVQGDAAGKDGEERRSAAGEEEDPCPGCCGKIGRELSALPRSSG
jgi:nitrogen fixation NifU-like protein